MDMQLPGMDGLKTAMSPKVMTRYGEDIVEHYENRWRGAAGDKPAASSGVSYLRCGDATVLPTKLVGQHAHVGSGADARAASTAAAFA